MILCRSISLFFRRNTGIPSISLFKNHFNTTVSLSSTESAPKILTHDLVKNHTEWFVLKSYIKYLVKFPKECKFERCVNILINIGDRITQYNKKSGLLDSPTTKWEWNMGVLRRIPGSGPGLGSRSLNLVGDNFGPLDVMNIMKIFSKLRLYHRINNHKFQLKRNENNVVKQTTTVDKSYQFFSELIDDINPKSFKIVGSNFNYKSIGPLRFNGDGFIAYPMILSNPFLFELTDPNFTKWIENSINNPETSSKSIRKNFTYFIDTVMAQFLDQLLILVSNSDFSVSKLCVLSMYLSVMIYGSKLRRKDGSKIDTRVLNSLQNILDYTCEAVKMNKDDISLRSLAYLVNCSKPRFDLLNIVAKRIIYTDRPIDADFLENFCYSFSRCYYNDDLLYNKLASLVNEDCCIFTPVVTVNLILSFSRVGKLDLVKNCLFNRLLSFSEHDFKKFGPGLLNSLSKLTQEYPELAGISFNKNNKMDNENSS